MTIEGERDGASLRSHTKIHLKDTESKGFELRQAKTIPTLLTSGSYAGLIWNRVLSSGFNHIKSVELIFSNVDPSRPNNVDWRSSRRHHNKRSFDCCLLDETNCRVKKWGRV